MKRVSLFTVSAIIIIFIAFSCSKKPVVLQNQPALLPLKAGNMWIYQDSTFDTSKAVIEAYIDTAVMTTQTTNSGNYPSTIFYGFEDTAGWFGGTVYQANLTDANFSYVLQMDSVNSTPYIFYQSVPSDNYRLDYSQYRIDSTCIGTFTQYGNATTTLINGFNCTKNVYYTRDCNYYVKEAVVIYICKGTGIVRIEDYLQQNKSANPPLYLNYSQTLQKFIPKL